MEYAAILLLLKKRRRPTRTVDEGLKTILSLVPAATDNGDVNNPPRPQRRKVYPSQQSTAAPVHVPAVEHKVSDHKQALCDNIDAWALWVSPPVFFTFNCVYWIAYRHVNEADLHF